MFLLMRAASLLSTVKGGGDPDRQDVLLRFGSVFAATLTVLKASPESTGGVGPNHSERC